MAACFWVDMRASSVISSWDFEKFRYIGIENVHTLAVKQRRQTATTGFQTEILKATTLLLRLQSIFLRVPGALTLVN
jgi:hypothetical protein